jgi:hypothetical protein
MDLVRILGKLNITDIRSTVRQRVSVRPFEQECKSATKWDPLESETSLCDWRAVCLQVGVPVGADWDPTKLSFSVLCRMPIQNRRGVPLRC